MNTIDKDMTGDSLAIYDNGLRLTCEECGRRFTCCICQCNEVHFQRMEAENPSNKTKAMEWNEIINGDAFVDF